MSLMKQKYDEFNFIKKQILNNKLSTDPIELEEHKWNIIQSYNNFLTVVVEDFQKVDQNGQSLLENKVKSAREKLVACLNVLGCVYVLPNEIYGTVEAATIGSVAAVLERNEENLKALSSDEKASSKSELLTEERRQKVDLQEQYVIMADERRLRRELLEIVNRQIRKPYDGEPMGLQAFISNVEIVRDFATTNELREKLLIYVKGRLEGRAREIVTDDVETIEELMSKLRKEIVPEASAVVLSRIASLRYSRGNQEEFAGRAEELADALRRTLVMEGMTPDKANEVTIDKIIQLCCGNAGSNVVKAVLRASKFETAKEVVSTLIIGNEECVKERQESWYVDNDGSEDRFQYGNRH